MSSRSITTLAILAALLLASMGSAKAQVDGRGLSRTVEGRIEPDQMALASGKHVTHHLRRPTDLGDFTSLEEWVKANYTTYLIPNSMTHAVQNGRDAISFITVGEDGIYDHHILYDADGEFVLQTTSDLKIPGAGEDGPELDSGNRSSKTKSMVAAATSATSTCGGYACNCTLYARCLVGFPSPATYYTEKVKAINWPYPNYPWYGYVAVMNISPPYGHLGVVNGIGADPNWHTIVSLNEANYRACQITYTRNGTPASMRIVGYYRPY